jgi:type II secretory ATPase GspE/PulE/Tfp pilus assembly ATPase PilB-like protein
MQAERRNGDGVRMRWVAGRGPWRGRAEGSPGRELLNHIVTDANPAGAGDIYLEPGNTTYGPECIDGVCQEVMRSIKLHRQC